MATTTQSGVDLIAAERQRQIDAEGWTTQHDDEHAGGEMALAGAIYAWPSPRPLDVKKAWPWDRAWFKPTVPEIDVPPQACECRTVDECSHFGHASEASKRAARIRDLVKAGALVAAEIDRLHRAAAPTGGE